VSIPVRARLGTMAAASAPADLARSSLGSISPPVWPWQGPRPNSYNWVAKPLYRRGATGKVAAVGILRQSRRLQDCAAPQRGLIAMRRIERRPERAKHPSPFHPIRARLTRAPRRQPRERRQNLAQREKRWETDSQVESPSAPGGGGICFHWPNPGTTGPKLRRYATGPGATSKSGVRSAGACSRFLAGSSLPAIARRQAAALHTPLAIPRIMHFCDFDVTVATAQSVARCCTCLARYDILRPFQEV
jgi:hypothetical protein